MTDDPRAAAFDKIRDARHVLKESDSLSVRTVGGDRMSLTLMEFEHRCCVAIEREMENTNPDNGLIGLLCEAVRLSREMCRLAEGERDERSL
jgi:hypothetical protein